MHSRLASRLESLWYRPEHPMRWLLAPFEGIYRFLFAAERLPYRLGLKRVEELPVPVIVVGNITVGGTGKTPCVIWLANELRARGFRVGCISRGYGGNASSWPRRVDASSDPGEVGDEPVLIAQATSCPVAVDPDRVRAARFLLADGQFDVLIADDGLQHHALPRAFEIAVVDGERGLGNGACLPAGPLREPRRRLNHVDAVIVNGGSWGEGSVFRAALVPDYAIRITDGERRALGDFRDVEVHAVAGIGNPERFFEMLRAHGLKVESHALPDHASLRAEDLEFDDDRPVLMTAKDAVKVRELADPRHWSVVVRLEFKRGDGDRLLRRVLRDL